MRGIFVLLGIAATIAAMILLCCKVLPQSKDGTFSNKYLQMIHDYFNFKKLYIESVLKFIFALATVTCVVMGIIGLLMAVFNLLGGFVHLFDYGSGYFSYLMGSFVVSVLGSAATAVLGPVALRLVYEGTMMLILLVKNVIEINNKINAPAQEAPVEQPVGAAAAEDAREE
ncbi:MAG: hypothetical protein J6A62_06905 [Oscillospiraceae bacterium]|nr:hypothetical protein [Oscillospiraceae bacterium]